MKLLSKKCLFIIVSFFIFVFNFNYSFAIIDATCSSRKPCDTGEICTSGKCVASSTPVITQCSSTQFKVNVGSAGVVCKDKIDAKKGCYYGSSDNNSNATCKSGYCNPSTKLCEDDPDCTGIGKYKLTTGASFLGGSKGQCIEVDTGMDTFLSTILRFIFGSIGTLTVIIIITAGFMWSFSAGNKNTIAKAQKMISDAVIGLVLALTSGLMLQVVNPSLLDLGSLFTKVRPKTINIMKQSEPSAKDQKTQRQSMPADCKDPLPTEAINFIQNRDPYNNLPYNNTEGAQICYTTDSNGKSVQETIGMSGCAPTAAAKVLKYLGSSTNPKEAAQYAGDNGFVKCDAGTDDTFFSSIAKSKGYKYESVSDYNTVRSLLASSKPLIVLVKGIGGTCTEYFTKTGHYLVASCYDPFNNSVIINDPYIWSVGPRTRADFDSFFNCFKTGAYYIHK